MKIARIKIKLPTLTTRDEAEAVMNALARDVNEQRSLAAERDQEILALNQKYEAPLAGLAQAIQISTESLHAWADANPEQFLRGRKSVEMLSGVLGFRTGTPKLALLNRSFTWDKVLGLVARVPGWTRTRSEVHKETILAEYGQAANKADFAGQLSGVGLKVTQDESFFVEPRLTEIETRQTAIAV